MADFSRFVWKWTLKHERDGAFVVYDHYGHQIAESEQKTTAEKDAMEYAERNNVRARIAE